MATKSNKTHSFLKLRKSLLSKLGPIQSIILEHFIDLQQNLFEGQFYQQQTRIAEFMGISKKVVSSNIKKLIYLGLINVTKKSVDNQPSKNYYKVDIEKVNDLLESEVTKSNIVKLQKGTEVGYKKEHSEVTKGNVGRLQKGVTKTIPTDTIPNEIISKKTIPVLTRSDPSSIREMSFVEIYSNGIDIDIDEFLNNK
jgi:predicted transcriptional regulator